MAVFSIKSFGGISPKTPPRYLQDSQAQVAINCPVFAGSLVPLPNVTATPVVTLPNAGVPQTIYRYGQDVDVDERYWFSWDKPVDVCRGQIAGDPIEWTFYTGDGIPKATYNSIALGGAALPTGSIPLGVPNPASRLDALPDGTFDDTDEFAAELTLSPVALDNLTDAGLEVSLDNGTTYTLVELDVPYTPPGGVTIPTLPATNRAVYVAGRINTVITGVTATVKLNEVVITTSATGPAVSLILRGIRGIDTSDDTTGEFTYSGWSLSNTASGLQDPLYLLKKDTWEVIALDLPPGKSTRVKVEATKPASDSYELLVNITTTTPPANAAAVVALITDNWLNGGRTLDVFAVGSTVVLKPNGTGYGATVGGAGGFGGRIRVTIDKLDANEKTYAKEQAGSASTTSYAYVFLTKAAFDTYLRNKYSAVTINGNSEVIQSVGSPQTISFVVGIGAYIDDTITDDFSAVMIRTTSTGSGASILIKSGTYPSSTSTDYFTLSAQGSEEAPSIPESRVYTYTWVSKIAQREFESGPAEPSLAVDVFDGQKVKLSTFQSASASGGKYYINGIYEVTARRIYRSVNGVYLFVAEIPATQSEYWDESDPDDLSEEMRVTNWAPPPPTLTGLINMPNGMMAGFVNRDVYFCEPYFSHAWPENYVQTVDYPIVGLGRMDTTLAVLTTGVPYFIQGSHPDSMVVVKSDIQQSCASKRSIVSINGTVIYASPDGLVMLSSGGSKIITDNLFTRAQWQGFNPSSIHAYQHDSKYIAFYDNGTVQGGFMYDLISGQFVLHDIYATTGYNDLQRDQLFLAFADRSVRRWFDGPNMNYTWRTKLFTMPQVMTFSCAQVEASSYPVTAKFYCDNSTTPYYTIAVSSRNPFRLPVQVGRDWEVQLEGTSEVFAINVAQSMQELAGA